MANVGSTGVGSTVKYALGAAVALVAIMSGSVAHAADLAISIDTIIDGGVSAGEEAPLETTASGDLEDATCTVRSVRLGQGESNVGNDLIVRSGDDSVQLVDVEREPDAVTEGGEITLGPTISIALVMGEDERFGAAISVEFDCKVLATTSTASTLIAATSEPPSEAASSIPAGDQAEPTVSTPALLAETGAGSVGGTAIAAALVIVGATLMWFARRPAALADACGTEGR